MKTLYIDTHLNDINIILFDDTKVIKEKAIIGQNQNSTLLMPTLIEVCPKKDFDRIVVVNGPGSFTGVRLGVTVAKTLAFTMNKEIYPMSYFELLNLSSDDNEHYFAMDEKNGYFVAHYKNHMLCEDLTYLKNEEYKEFSKDKNIETDVTIDFNSVIKSLETVESTHPHEVNPIYIKKIEVEND